MHGQVRQNIYGAWLDGDVTAMEALRSLCDDYEELDKAYKDFEGMREQTREQIGNVLVRVGDKVEIKGFGRLSMTAPGVMVRYDKALLDALIYNLRDVGHDDIADQISGCRIESMKAGGLRIEREKADAARS